ncbi:ATP-dependent zinc metalloprotease FtsH [Leptolyngbya iicbica]|uniref:ATP-dependent zinc metalloprotease FtsH n=2 Tax=Cyanophyceae TaxID=3028117 RepID=A0A4Q7EFJ8_9CYAN|nr:ATP-dependent zinc metalloprotease FtsH [Leptolyngbya sp. LK]RZM82065.1 ATP-dependent metallopeptidase FtsH/Yme1/Tma family protein [Leptolyngbya sp. LK]
MSFSNQFRNPKNPSGNFRNNNDGNNRRPRWLGFGLLAALTIFVLANVFTQPGQQLQQVPYSQFLEQVEAGEVKEAVIAPDQIRYQLKGAETGDAEAPQGFRTVPVQNDQQLAAKLRANDVEFSAIPPQNDGGGSLFFWLIAPILLYLVVGFFIRRGQGGPGGAAALGVGKSKARLYAEGDTHTTFDDVAGVDESKAELREIVDFLRNSDKYTRLGAKVPKGVLLIGPPGTGKTLLARAVAGEANVPFLSISGSEFIELFVGVGASRVRDLFEQAKKQAPCIVFIDELDALGRSRGGQGPMAGGGFSEQEQTLNQLLNEMDGFNANNGVIILAATNRPEVLDPALQRPGRFDRQVLVDRPDKSGREAILQVHTPGVKLADDVDLNRLAARTPGFAGADLENLVNEAALLAARRDGDEVKMSDFNEAIERVVAGLEKKSRVLSDDERKTVAYHEVGHAIIGSLMPGAGKVEKISIVPRGVGALGYTLQLPEEDKFLAGEDELRGRISILLGGRSAEELVFRKVSTGAGDDIQKATDLADRLVTVYGMSDRLGPIAFEKQQQQFIPGMGNQRRPVSPTVMESIDTEIKSVVDGAHHMALKVLMSNREILEEMAHKLLETEVLEKATLSEYLSQVTDPEGLASWLQTGEIDEAERYLQERLDAVAV